MSLTFREMLPDDVPACVTVRVSTVENAITLSELEDEYGITPQSMAWSLDHGVKGWLCEDAGRAVGFSMGDKTNGEVQVVAVLPAYEGRGIARTLLTEIADWLFAQGHERVWLYSNADTSIRAHGFYRKLGWRPTGEMNGDDEVLVLDKPAVSGVA